ncbi:conserved hypothetical protein [Aeropyrum pernix K1]|uniref:YjbQ family protein n=1 Tax=Aeropyrum pernix (strain ATCC 700893 / DSM 11879 / JCM 9820 / NBRC 100138 / K1) TaxID=272557 RepID=Q9YBS9_AERPE|nr:conserved hypothetical protein [Aeropyrum pernix K1]
MKVETGSFTVKTERRLQVLDVTGKVEEWLSTVGGVNGLLVVYVPHTTAAVAVNEAEPRLMEDIVEFIRELTKPGGPWKHNLVDVNAHAHLGNTIIGDSRVIPVVGGRLSLGTWQRILFVEMDGPRERTVNLLYLGE